MRALRQAQHITSEQLKKISFQIKKCKVFTVKFVKTLHLYILSFIYLSVFQQPLRQLRQFYVARHYF